MTPRIVCLSLATFLSVAVARAQTPPANPPTVAPAGIPPASTLAPKGADEPLFSIKLSDDTIDQVLKLLEEYTGRTVMRPGQGLPATFYTVNIKNATRAEAILALETMLSLNGVGVAPLGDKFIKVIPAVQTKMEAPLMITGSTLDLPPSGRVAMKVFQLEFLRAEQFFQPLGIYNQYMGGPVILASANAAMVTDTISSLQRLETLIKILDRPITGNAKPKFYTLTNGAKASELVNKIRTTIPGSLQAQFGTSTTYNADDRTNQIILIADPREYPFFDELIAKLDVKSDPNSRNEVIYLKHAKADVVQKMITQLLNSQNAITQRNGSQSVRPGAINYPNLPAITTPQPGATPSAAAAPVATSQPMGIDGNSGTNEFSSIVNVVNDDRSNAIIVSGTADDIRLIKELVAKIDVILAQVNIEVIIAEVTLNDTQKSGLQALNLTVGTDTPNGPGGDNGHGTHITNVAGTVAGWAVTEGVVNPLAFKAAMADVGSKSNIKILSVPTITTTHGKKGTVSVGEKRPIITSTVAATTTGAAQSQYQLTDITLELSVTPLIGDDGSIQLDIEQKVDDVIGTVAVDANQVPVIGTRKASSYMNVFDGEIRVLGGLQRTKNERDRNKLGFIYEIPILSQLLGGRTNTSQRTELLIFIRPHVMRLNAGNAEALKAINTLSNKEQVKQFLKDPAVPAKESFLEKIK